MYAWSAEVLNLRCGHVARGGDGEAGLREGTGKICLKVPLERGKRQAIANFEREFIPY